jgi:hypothetical protein
VRGGQLHLEIDAGGAGLERAAKDPRIAEHVVDAAPVAGERRTRRFGGLGCNLGIGVRRASWPERCGIWTRYVQSSMR